LTQSGLGEIQDLCFESYDLWGDTRPVGLMNTIASGANEKFVTQVPLLIVGAGAAGLCAALAAKESGLDVLMVERNTVPTGSTALSAGLIPAAGTRFQRAKGIADSADLFVTDIHRKSKGEADPAVVAAVAQSAAPLVEWLADRHGLPFDLVGQFQLSWSFGPANALSAEPNRPGID
jgi:fumarate reductase flavoprotein subunit